MIGLNELKGIGPKTASLLNKLNIFSVDDLVEHYPFRYDVLSRSDLSNVSSEDKAIIDGKVESIPMIARFRGGLNKLTFRLATVNGPLGVSIFNRAFLKPNLGIGTNVIVIGKYDRQKNILNASDIKFGTLTNKEQIEAVYHTTSGITNKNISGYINTALSKHGNDIVDYIPKKYIEAYDFLNKKTALNIVHNPPSFDKLKQASIRLKYEELFKFMFKINYLKLENDENNLGVKREGNIDKINELINKLPFELTNDQKKALDEVIGDLNSDKRMNRLLQGDVGSGKTIVSILAMYYNSLCSYQSALMAPTEILAVQHYNNIKDVLKDTGVRIELLTGSMTKKDK